VDARCAEYDGATLLMAAAIGGQEAVVRMLLQCGASVNLQDSVSGTALMDAAANGRTTIVQALLDAKADALLQATPPEVIHALCNALFDARCSVKAHLGWRSRPAP
jgi:ankyrin repeat protein